MTQTRTNRTASPRRTVFVLAALAVCAGGCAPIEEGGDISYAPAGAAAPVSGETASAREQGGRECFFTRNVTGFRNVEDDDKAVLVDVRAGETFLFELQNRCPNLRFARGIGFDQVGTGRICDGLDVDLIVPDPNLGPQICRVTMIRKLSSGEPGARAGARD